MRNSKVLDIYKSELELEGLTGLQMSIKLGMDYASYRNATKSKAVSVPKWVLGYLHGRGYRVEGRDLVHPKKKSTALQYVCLECGGVDK